MPQHRIYLRQASPPQSPTRLSSSETHRIALLPVESTRCFQPTRYHIISQSGPLAHNPVARLSPHLIHSHPSPSNLPPFLFLVHKQLRVLLNPRSLTASLVLNSRIPQVGLHLCQCKDQVPSLLLCATGRVVSWRWGV